MKNWNGEILDFIFVSFLFVIWQNPLKTLTVIRFANQKNHFSVSF